MPLITLLCLYNALFLSFMQYGIIVWGSTCITYVDPIFKLQKRLSELSHLNLFAHILLPFSKT